MVLKTGARHQNSDDFVESVVRDALPQLETAFSKLTLIQMVGHRESVGHQLVEEAVAKRFERSWRDYIRGLPVEALASEYELLWSLLELKRESDPDEPSMSIPADVRVTRALLVSARSESCIQVMGSRAVTKSPRLAWKALIDLYGGEETLRRRVEDLRKTHLDDCAEVIALADQYLAGWNPKDFGDE